MGLLSSVAPRIIGYFEQRQIDNHEIEITKLKLDGAAQQLEITKDIAVVKANAEEIKSIHDSDDANDGSSFINALKASIRPVVTYSFFVMFVGIKTTVAYLLVAGGAGGMEILSAVWDIETMSLFGAIMSFWFGARILEKMDYSKLTRPQFIVTNKK